MTRYGKLFPEIFFEKFIHFELSSQINTKIKEVEYSINNQQFLIDKLQKIQMLFFIIFFILLNIFVKAFSFTANKLWPFIFAIAFVYTFAYLDDLIPPLKYDFNINCIRF